MGQLGLSAAVFVLSHFALSALPVRNYLVARLGEWLFMGLYSLIALSGFSWLLGAYVTAPYVEVWHLHTAFRHLAMSIMPLCAVLLISGYTSANASAIGFNNFKHDGGYAPYGVFRITRHPVIWAVGLWALTHLLASTAAAEIVLFGAFTVLSFGGAWHMDRRFLRQRGAQWQAYLDASSSVPFLAIAQGRQKLDLGEIGALRILSGFMIYAAMLWLHELATGLSPLPL